MDQSRDFLRFVIIIAAVTEAAWAQTRPCPRLDTNNNAKLLAYCSNTILQNIARTAFSNHCVTSESARNLMVNFVSSQLSSSFASSQWLVALIDAGYDQIYDFGKDGTWTAATACMAFGTTGQHALVMLKVDWETESGLAPSLICSNRSYGSSINAIISSNGGSATAITSSIKRNVLPNTWTSLAIGVKVTKGSYSLTQRHFYSVDSNQCNIAHRVYIGSNRYYWTVINAKLSAKITA